MPRESDFNIVNLALDGKLRDWLVEWRRRTHPPLSFPEVARRVNVALTDRAERLGEPPPAHYDQTTIHRWCLAVGIEDQEFEEDR